VKEVRTPSKGEDDANELERAHGPLQSYLRTRSLWMDRNQRPASPWEVGSTLTAALDIDLTALASNYPEIAVIAVGGYGRRELCLFSDIDLLLLHEGPAPEEAVRAILYPLWDTGVKVGHATRTVRSTLSFVGEDFPTLCTLLTARIVCGPGTLVEELNHGLSRLIGTPRIGFEDRLATEERQVWSQEPYAVQDLDLKNSRGGLRSLHRLQWDRRRAELLNEASELEADVVETQARQTLLGVRAALHAVQGRAADRYALELRDAVGRWLGREPLDVATEVYKSARAVDARAALRWAEVRPAGTDPIAHAGLAVSRFIRSRWGRSGRGDGAATPFGFARAAAGSHSGGRLSAWQCEFASKSGPPDWTAGDRSALLSLLAAGSPGWEALLSLWDTGWLVRAIPEISHLSGLAQSAPFHLHPADAHLGRTVNEVVTIADQAGTWTADLADEIGGLDELLLSAFLHDAGKGLGGNHSEIGAQLASELLNRAGFGPAAGGLVSRAVRQHLLLPDAAVRRDIDDPLVVHELAATIADLDLLRMLVLLSVADARATGPDMWSPWKETLIRGLYAKVAAQLEGTSSTLHMELEGKVASLAADLSPGVVSHHLELMPSSYLTRFDPGTIASHVRLAKDPLDLSEVRSAAVTSAPASTFIVAARDRPGLLSTIAGVLALHNLNVLEARVATRSDGLALDTFRVADALGSTMVGQGRWPGVREDLELAVRDELDLETRLAAKRAAYGRRNAVPLETQVFVADRNGKPSIEVRTADRVGLLYDLSAAIAHLGLDVELAKIDTRGREAIDVFEVRNPAGYSVEQIRTALAAALAI
jgi:[protein-PII] uridylyltransferase